MSSPEEGPERARSIKSLRAVFEQRADLDAFWVANVDFSKEKVGLSTQLLRRGESAAEFTGFPTAFLATGRPGTAGAPRESEANVEDAQQGHDSWRDLQFDGSIADTCELPQVGLNVMGEFSGTVDSRVGAAGLLSDTMPGSPQMVYPSGGYGLGVTTPNAAHGASNLSVTGASDLMMPHAIGVGMGLNTASGFLQDTSKNAAGEVTSNPLFEIGSELADFMRPGTLSRKASQGGPTSFTPEEVQKRLAGIAKSLASSKSSFQAASACRRLTAVIHSTKAEHWEAPLASHGIIKLLMPHPLASEASLSHASSQTLAVLASASRDATLLALTEAGTIGVMSKVMSSMLDSTSMTPEDTSKAIVLLLRAALLPVMRCRAAAAAATESRTDDLTALAELGQKLLEQRGPGQQRGMVHVQCLLGHLQCTHALLASAPPAAVVPVQRFGLLRVALDAYELSHSTATASACAWELRKACAVLEVLSTAFQRLEDDIMGGSDGPACATSRRTLAVDAVVQAVSGGGPPGAQPLVEALLADVRLRDRPNIAALALRGLQLLLVHCGITVAELVPAHVVAVSALADVWEQMGLVQPYCELLMHFWCESAALSEEVKLRLRALVCRTLGRQGSLTRDTLAFVRQHVVPHCVKWLDWETSPAFAYSLRSFAAQDRDIRKTLISGGFIDAVVAAAMRGEPIAADVLLDLSSANNRIARHAARAGALSGTPVLISAASSPARAERGVLALALSTGEAKDEFCKGLPGWITAAAADVATGEAGLEGGARMLRMVVVCAEAGGALRDAVSAVPAASQLVVDVVGSAVEAGDIAAGIAAAAHLEMPGLLLQRLCKGRLAPAVRRIPVSRAAELLQAFEAVAALLEHSDAAKPTPAELMLAASLQPACVAAVKGLLSQWDKGALDAAYGGGWLEEHSQAPSADKQQEVCEARLTSGGRRRALMPGLAAAFVDQVGAVHAAARVALMLTQEATCDKNLVDPQAQLGPHLLSVLDLVEANCQDVRLRRLLEAAALMLRAGKDHLEGLQEHVPADGKKPLKVLDQVASAVHMWQGRLVKPARLVAPRVDAPDRHQDNADQANNGSIIGSKPSGTDDREEQALNNGQEIISASCEA